MDQVADLQADKECLETYRKALDKVIKMELGCTLSEARKKIDGPSHFEQEICRIYDLKDKTDKEAFLRVMGGESSIRFFQTHR